MGKELAQVKQTYSSDYEKRIEDLVLGLGKQSAEVLAEYDQKMSQLQNQIEKYKQQAASTVSETQAQQVKY